MVFRGRVLSLLIAGICAAGGLRAQGLPNRPTATIGAGVPLAEWQWQSQRYLPLRGSAEPASVTETVRIVFAARGDSTVRITYEVKAPSTGFAAGMFHGAPMVRYVIGHKYDKISRQRGRLIAQGAQPFGLMEADPPGHRLAEYSILGGLERGNSVAAVAAAAFEGDNTFAISGDTLVFINRDPKGTLAGGFPAQIVLEPVTAER